MKQLSGTLKKGAYPSIFFQKDTVEKPERANIEGVGPRTFKKEYQAEFQP